MKEEFFYLNLFNWRLIALQYCIGLAIHQHESSVVYTCSSYWIPLPPSSPYHPSGSSQCTSPKHPVSCIEPGLAIRFLYDIIYVSMLFSQIIPTSPSPTESKRLFYPSLEIVIQGTACHAGPHGESSGFSGGKLWAKAFTMVTIGRDIWGREHRLRIG